MAASFNRVILMGRLTKDPELRYIPSGTAVATFRIAVNSGIQSQNAQKKDETLFINVNVWESLAENCGKYLSKGSPVLVEGRLRERSWQGADGQTKNIVEVVARSVQFLSSGPRNEQGESDNKGASLAEIDLSSEGLSDGKKNGPAGADEVPF